MQQRIAIAVMLLFITTACYPKVYDITGYGARPDGKTPATKSIQRAIDECSKAGGGIVLVPAGSFYTGTLYLKNFVTLYLEKGAVLYGSTDSTDYPFNAPVTVKSVSTHGGNGKPKRNLALIYAEAQQDIAIEGAGTINGNGDNPFWQRGDNGPNRPKLIFFISCRNVVVKDVFLTNSAFWMQDYLGCDGVKIQGIRVYNHANWNEDGIDIDSRNVTVSDCIIDSDDDAICLKSYLNDRPCENVTITNCVIATNCNGIKFGTPGYGGFKNIAISNCSINASAEDHIRKWADKFKNISASPASVSGISLECVDGGKTEDILINNITIRSTLTPIFIRLGNRIARLKEDTATRVATLRNVIISNIISESHSHRASSITAYPGTYVENVQLHHIIFDIHGGGTEEERKLTVKENDGGYPTPNMFGESLPAYGFYVRHIKGIRLSDIQFNLLNGDARYAIALDDVQSAFLNGIIVNEPGAPLRMIKPQEINTARSTGVYLEQQPVQ